MADNSTKIIISAEDRTRAAFESAKAGIHGIEAAAARLPLIGASMAGLFSVATFAGAIRSAIQFTASLDDMAEKTGASVETLSGLVRVAQIGGHEIGLVEDATIKLAKGLAAADDKSSGAARALRALGLSANELRTMDTGDAIKVVADRLNQYRDGAGKTALAIDLLGKSGAQALPYLKDLAEQGALVKTVTAEQATAAEKFEKSINRLKVEVGDLTRNLVSGLIPALNKFFETANAPGAGLHGAFAATVDQALFGGDLPGRIKELQTQLADLEEGRSVRLIPGVREAEMAGLRAKIAAMKEMYAQQVLLNNAASYSNEGRGGGLRSLTGYVSTDEKAKTARAAKERGNPYAGLAGFEEGRSAAEIMRGLHAEDEQAQRLIDMNKKLADSYKQLADPLQKYREQLDEINRLRSEGYLTSDQAIAAEWRVNDAMQEQVDKMSALADQTSEANDMARQLGLTFSSAFEDAIIEGKKFSEVLKAIAQDLVRMALRKSVTEPAANLFVSLLGAAFGGGKAAGGPVYPGQYYVVGEQGPEILVPNQAGTVIPNGVAAGGGVVVNLIESPGGGGQVSSRSEGSNTVIDIMVEQIKASMAADIMTGNGAVPAAMSRTFGLNRAAGAF